MIAMPAKNAIAPAAQLKASRRFSSASVMMTSGASPRLVNVTTFSSPAASPCCRTPPLACWMSILRLLMPRNSLLR